MKPNKANHEINRNKTRPNVAHRWHRSCISNSGPAEPAVAHYRSHRTIAMQDIAVNTPERSDETTNELITDADPTDQFTTDASAELDAMHGRCHSAYNEC